MQYPVSAIFFVALGCDLAYSFPTKIQHVTSSALDTAQGNWEADTAIVSSFLSSADSFSGTTLANAAQTALNAENNELTQKVVLDNQFVFVNNPNPTVQKANAVLVDQGTFQFVVNGLQNLATNGATMSAAQVSAAVASINTDRCNKVLPAIDQYFTAASSFLKNGQLLKAVRPTNCP